MSDDPQTRCIKEKQDRPQQCELLSSRPAKPMHISARSAQRGLGPTLSGRLRFCVAPRATEPNSHSVTFFRFQLSYRHLLPAKRYPGRIFNVRIDAGECQRYTLVLLLIASTAMCATTHVRQGNGGAIRESSSFKSTSASVCALTRARRENASVIRKSSSF